jgi:stage II sporulation SpoE-like protein
MRDARSLLLWLLVGVAGLILLAWAFPRAFPFLPKPWTVSRAQAVAIALERFRDLGEPVADPYVVVLFDRDFQLERRLQLALDRGAEHVWDSGLANEINGWRVIVFPPGAQQDEWKYQAYVSPSGEVLSLRLRLDPEAKGAPISRQEAAIRAAAFLRQQGIDLSRYVGPEFRSQQLAGRTDMTVRYRDRRNPLPAGSFHGVQVFFAGDRLAGFGTWLDDPGEKDLARSLRGFSFLGVSRVVWVFLLAGVLAFPFLKRYHEGEIGVRRGAQIFLLVLVTGTLLVLLASRVNSQGNSFGFASRQQNTWLVFLFAVVFMVTPSAVLAFFAWSAGESVCRERWGHKLASFDALFQGDLANRTVARSTFRGWMAGLGIAGGAAALLLAVHAAGGWAFSSLIPRVDTRWPALEPVLAAISILLPFDLAVVLWLLPVAARRLGVWGGSLAAALVIAVVFPALPTLAVPMGWTLAVCFVLAAALTGLFVATDLLTVLLAGFVALTLFGSYPLLTAPSASLQLQGWIALGLLAAPLMASLRYLGSDVELVYRYEDVPPHVRRIAERERQRVELETARRIQSSILPELPPRLAGVDIAHAYLPASEVGGDFYDVLALEDGRLAVAVGDVAGHGVSSGLIMSMAKSALAVQVTFDPQVAEVFRTLNRTVFQTARKRLLATLCYALIDPRRLEMLYASAGHLFPYRVSAAGRVEALESVAYPLGVRGELQVESRTARLSPGDTLFLFSDGLVEARREGSEEQFGFERLEASLARHAGRGVEGLRDGVLADVTRFTGNAPREDDQTVLVLRLP